MESGFYGYAQRRLSVKPLKGEPGEFWRYRVGDY